MSSNSRYKSKNDADEAVSVVSLTSRSGDLEFDDIGQVSTKIYDKRDDFNCKIINFPNMCSNIPASPAYGVYISQLIRYARASSNYFDFLKRHLHLRNRLLDQGYTKIRLIRSLSKFIDVDTICRRSWYIAAHVWKIYDFKIEVVPLIINFSTDLTNVVKFEV
jgi:hypothetical protein